MARSCGVDQDVGVEGIHQPFRSATGSASAHLGSKFVCPINRQPACCWQRTCSTGLNECTDLASERECRRGTPSAEQVGPDHDCDRVAVTRECYFLAALDGIE